MNSNAKALKSGIIYGIASVINAGMVFLTTPFFTRVMSKGAYGEYNNFLSWYNILSVLSFNLYASFISARRDFKDEFDSYVKSMCALNFLILTAWLFLTLLFRKSLMNIMSLSNVYIICMYMYIAFYQVFMMYQINERYEYRYKISALLIISVALITAILSMAFVCSFENQLLGRIIGQIVPTIIAGCISIVFIFFRSGKISFAHWKYALPICLPYIPHLLSLTILNSLDKTMISNMVGNEETAVYSVAYVCGSVISLVVGVLNNAFTPWMTDMLDNGNENVVRNFSRYYIIVFEVLLIGILLFAPELVSILGGSKYDAAIPLMPTVIIGCGMQLIYTMYVNIEQYQKSTGYMAIVSMVAAGVNYILNYFGILKFGYQIAALTTMVSYLILVVGHIYVVKKTKIGIYNDKFSLGIIAINIIEVPLFLWIYEYDALRLLSFVVYVLLIIVLVLKYKKEVLRLIKMVKG